MFITVMLGQVHSQIENEHSSEVAAKKYISVVKLLQKIHFSGKIAVEFTLSHKYHQIATISRA